MLKEIQRTGMQKYVNSYHTAMEETQQAFIALRDVMRKSQSKTSGKIKKVKALKGKLLQSSLELLDISTVLKNNGYPSEGEAGLKRVIVLFGYLEDTLNKATALNNLAVLYEKLDNLTSAFDSYTEALNIYKTLNRSFTDKDDLSNYANVLHGYASTLYVLHHNKTDAIQYFLEALEIRRSLASDPKYKLSKTYLNLGKIYLDDNNLAEAKSNFKSGLSVLVKNSSPDPDIKKFLALGLSDVYCKQADPELFKTPLLQHSSDKISVNNDVSDFLSSAETYLNNYLQKKSEKDDNSTVIMLLQKSLSLLEPYDDLSNIRIRILYVINQRMLEAKDHVNAEKYARELVKITQVTQDHKSSVLGLIALAHALESNEKYHEALKAYEKASAALKAGVTGISSDFINITINSGKGLVFKVLSDYANAAACYECALQFHEQCSGTQSILVAETLVNLSSIYERQDRFSEMHAACERAISIFESAGHLSEMAGAILNQGVMHARQEQYENAEKCYLRAYRIFKEQQGEQSVHVARVLDNLGLMCYHKNDHHASKSYYERALAIFTDCLPKSSLQKCSLLSNYANLLASLCQFSEAEAILCELLDIYKKNNMYYSFDTTKSLDALGIMFAKKNYPSKAEFYLKESLQIKKRIYPNSSSEIGETLAWIAALDTSCDNREKNYIDAILHYEQSEMGSRAVTCNIRLQLAKHYSDRAKLLTDPKLRHSYFSKAQDLYEKVLEINHNFIKNALNDFSEEDLAGHLSLLNEMAAFYCVQNQPGKSAELFEKEANTWSRPYPRVSFECIERSIYFYEKCINTQDKRIELIAFKLKLLEQLPHTMRPWPIINDALAALQQLDTYDEHRDFIRQMLDAYVRFSGDIQMDIRVELEQCVTQYFEIQRLFLQKVEKHTLSYVSNRLVELFVSLRNILDQAYGRVLKHTYSKADQSKLPESYFPIRDSMEAWQFLFDRQQLLASYITISSENLKICNQNKTKYPEPPPINEILACLERAGIAEHIRKHTYRLLIFSHDIRSIPWQKEDLKKNPSLSYYSNQILEQICAIYKRRSQLALDTGCPNSYEAMLQEQPFLYFDVKKNTGKDKYWQGSWLERLSVINNDSKHVRLTHQERSVNLQQKEGTITKAQSKFFIQYLERRFYSWIFVEVLPDMLSDLEKIILSKSILDVLVKAGHIKDEKSAHPLATNYQASRIKGFPVSEQNRYRNAYHLEVKRILSSVTSRFDVNQIEKIVQPVADLLLRRASQYGDISYYEADTTLNVGDFFNIVLPRMHRLVSVFSEEINRLSVDLQPISEHTIRIAAGYQAINSCSKSLSKEIKQMDDAQWAEIQIKRLFSSLEVFYKAPNNFEHTKFTELRDVYANIDMLTQLLKRHHRPVECFNLLFDAAYKFQTHFSLLSIGYLEQAVQICGETTIEANCHWDAINLLVILYEQQNLFGKACRVLSSYMRDHDATDIALICFENLKKHLVQEKKKLDPDIFSQIEYLRDEIFHLSHECWDYHLSKSHSNELKIKNRVYELLVKTRHLLDHGFRRLLINTVLEPNNQHLSTDVLYNYPCGCITPHQLRKRLRASYAIDNASECYNLAESCISVIESSQTMPWLTELVDLTNKAKHERQPDIQCKTYIADISALKAIELFTFASGQSVLPFLQFSLNEVAHRMQVFFQEIHQFERSIKPEVLVTPLDELTQSQPSSIPDSPLPVEQLKAAGNQLVGQRRYFDALQYYNRAIAVDTRVAAVWLNKGIMHRHLGEYIEAISALDKALRLEPNYVKAKLHRAQCLLSSGEYRSAYSAFNDFITTSSTFYDEAFKGRYICQRYFAAQVLFLCVDLKLTPEGAVKISELRSGIQSEFNGLRLLGKDIESELLKVARILKLPPLYFNSRAGVMASGAQHRLPADLLKSTRDCNNIPSASISHYKAVCVGSSLPPLPIDVLAEGDFLLSYMFENRHFVQQGFDAAKSTRMRSTVMCFPRYYDRRICHRVLNRFPTTHRFVIRSSDIQGEASVLSVHRDELDAVLQAILPGSATKIPHPETYLEKLKRKYGSSLDEKTMFSLVNRILQWVSSSANEFMIEEHVINKTIVYQSVSYHPTMRVGLLIIKNDGVYSCHPTFAYWKLPPSGVATEQSDLSIVPFSDSTVPSVLAAEVSENDKALVFSQLVDELPRVISTMMDFSIETIADPKKQLDDELGRTYSHLANSASYVGQYELSRYFLNKSKPLFGHDFEYHREEGILHYFRGEYAQAVACYERAKEKNSREPSVYFRMGESYLALRDFYQAAEYFSKSLNLCISGRYRHRLLQVLATNSDFQQFWNRMSRSNELRVGNRNMFFSHDPNRVHSQNESSIQMPNVYLK